MHQRPQLLGREAGEDVEERVVGVVGVADVVDGAAGQLFVLELDGEVDGRAQLVNVGLANVDLGRSPNLNKISSSNRLFLTQNQ